ncbi:MAG: hypothetical protein KAI24_00360 [Planctomycetes bacterium]|nr:hypothetical protein [Planctomycetota bacterium]
MDEYRARFPGQKDSVLFCIHKLEQDPEASLRDFRDEAALRGIPTAGRALHSAKVLLGMATAKPRAPNRARTAAAEPAPEPRPEPRRESRRAPRRREPVSDATSIEDKVLGAVRQIQSAADQKTERLREAIREALTILESALDD